VVLILACVVNFMGPGLGTSLRLYELLRSGAVEFAFFSLLGMNPIDSEIYLPCVVRLPASVFFILHFLQDR